jgi:hypothetical protein
MVFLKKTKNTETCRRSFCDAWMLKSFVVLFDHFGLRRKNILQSYNEEFYNLCSLTNR